MNDEDKLFMNNPLRAIFIMLKEVRDIEKENKEKINRIVDELDNDVGDYSNDY